MRIWRVSCWRDGLSDAVTRGVLRTHQAAERAERLVRDLLDFTQHAWAEAFRIQPRLGDLHVLLQTALEEVQAAFPHRRMELFQKGNGQGSWDPERLAQVAQNLISNALKYSPEDSVVQVHSTALPTGVSFSVHNKGAPIPTEKIAALFEPFQRAVGTVDKATRSVGLGLYIVKQIVEAHGGAVTVRSTQKEDTTFTVSLPRTVAARRALPEK